MRRNSTSPLGALHPILFFVMIYGISLFLALFVCRTVYYSINDDSSASSQVLNAQTYSTAPNATALK